MNLRPETFEKMLAESQSAPVAETELATILAKDWCEQWGGWPEDSLERMAQIWAARPQARKLLAAIRRVSKTGRKALASAIAA